MKDEKLKELMNIHLEIYKETFKYDPEYEVIDELHTRFMKLIFEIDYDKRTKNS